MRELENHCCACPPEMGCLGSACPRINVPVYTCDHCGAVIDELFRLGDSEDLCEDCLKDLCRYQY